MIDSEIFRWKAQVSRSKGLVQDLHMLVCPIYIYMSIYIIFLKRFSMLLPLVHFGSCLKKILRRAVAEKYFAAALPDVRRLVGWVSLRCSSRWPKMAWLTGCKEECQGGDLWCYGIRGFQGAQLLARLVKIASDRCVFFSGKNSGNGVSVVFLGKPLWTFWSVTCFFGGKKLWTFWSYKDL